MNETTDWREDVIAAVVDAILHVHEQDPAAVLRALERAYYAALLTVRAPPPPDPIAAAKDDLNRWLIACDTSTAGYAIPIPYESIKTLVFS